MPSTATVTLERQYSNEWSIGFSIRGKNDIHDIDSVYIDKRTPGKHRNKACWGVSSQYKGQTISFWLDKLSTIGFDTAEFETACIEMGWEKEVQEWRDEQEELKNDS